MKTVLTTISIKHCYAKVVFLYGYAECRYIECLYAECPGAISLCNKLVDLLFT